MTRVYVMMKIPTHFSLDERIEMFLNRFQSLSESQQQSIQELKDELETKNSIEIINQDFIRIRNDVQCLSESIPALRAQRNKEILQEKLCDYEKFGARAWGVMSKMIQPISYKDTPRDKFLSWLYQKPFSSGFAKIVIERLRNHLNDFQGHMKISLIAACNGGELEVINDLFSIGPMQGSNLDIDIIRKLNHKNFTDLHDDTMRYIRMCIRVKNTGVLRFLMFNMSTKSPEHDYQVLDAVIRSDVRKLEELLSNSLEVSTNIRGVVVQLASELKCWDIVRLLLRYNQEIPDESRCQSMKCAINFNQSDIIEILAKGTVKSTKLITDVIHLAFAKGRNEQILRLFSKYFDALPDSSKSIIISVACKSGKSRFAKEMIRDNLRISDYVRGVVLPVAIKAGDWELVVLLLSGIDDCLRMGNIKTDDLLYEYKKVDAIQFALNSRRLGYLELSKDGNNTNIKCEGYQAYLGVLQMLVTTDEDRASLTESIGVLLPKAAILEDWECVIYLMAATNDPASIDMLRKNSLNHEYTKNDAIQAVLSANKLDFLELEDAQTNEKRRLEGSKAYLAFLDFLLNSEKDKDFAIIDSVKRGDWKKVALLLKGGKSVNDRDCSVILMTACRDRKWGFVEYIIANMHEDQRIDDNLLCILRIQAGIHGNKRIQDFLYSEEAQKKTNPLQNKNTIRFAGG